MTTANLTVKNGSIVWTLIDGRWQAPPPSPCTVQGVRTTLMPGQCAVCFAPTDGPQTLLCHDCAAVLDQLR